MKHSLSGGVLEHAIKRVKQQYGSNLSNKAIRRILREEKNRNKMENGWLLLEDRVVKMLGIELNQSMILVAIISGGNIVTIEDKINIESLRDRNSGKENSRTISHNALSVRQIKENLRKAI